MAGSAAEGAAAGSATIGWQCALDESQCRGGTLAVVWPAGAPTAVQRVQRVQRERSAVQKRRRAVDA